MVTVMMKLNVIITVVLACAKHAWCNTMTHLGVLVPNVVSLTKRGAKLANLNEYLENNHKPLCKLAISIKPYYLP